VDSTPNSFYPYVLLTHSHPHTLTPSHTYTHSHYKQQV